MSNPKHTQQSINDTLRAELRGLKAKVDRKQFEQEYQSEWPANHSRFRLQIVVHPGHRPFYEYDTLEACIEAAREINWIKAETVDRDGSWRDISETILFCQRNMVLIEAARSQSEFIAHEHRLLSNQEKWHV